jgi:hypothetical protein
MKIIHSEATQIIGPFKEVIENEDHLLVDGTNIRKSLLGVYSIVDDSVMFANAEDEEAYLLAESQKEKDSQFLVETTAIKTGYTQDEIDSWPKQEAEARAWFADNTAPTPLLDGIVSQTGEDKTILVDGIIEKADLFAAAFGAALGRKRSQ